MTDTETQAARIIRLCGIETLARWAGVSTTSVYRWDHAKEKGGSGGLIPVTYHQAILDGAIAEGISLTPDDFFPAASRPKVEQNSSSGDAAA